MSNIVQLLEEYGKFGSHTNCSFMKGKTFVMTNSTNMLLDCIQFLIYTIAPDILPFFQAVPRDMRNEVTTRKFHVCDGQR